MTLEEENQGLRAAIEEACEALIGDGKPLTLTPLETLWRLIARRIYFQNCQGPDDLDCPLDSLKPLRNAYNVAWLHC